MRSFYALFGNERNIKVAALVIYINTNLLMSHIEAYDNLLHFLTSKILNSNQTVIKLQAVSPDFCDVTFIPYTCV
jgi:hypothetical protein